MDEIRVKPEPIDEPEKSSGSPPSSSAISTPNPRSSNSHNGKRSSIGSSNKAQINSSSIFSNSTTSSSKLTAKRMKQEQLKTPINSSSSSAALTTNKNNNKNDNDGVNMASYLSTPKAKKIVNKNQKHTDAINNNNSNKFGAFFVNLPKGSSTPITRSERPTTVEHSNNNPFNTAPTTATTAGIPATEATATTTTTTTTPSKFNSNNVTSLELANDSVSCMTNSSNSTPCNNNNKNNTNSSNKRRKIGVAFQSNGFNNENEMQGTERMMRQTTTETDDRVGNHEDDGDGGKKDNSIEKIEQQPIYTIPEKYQPVNTPVYEKLLNEDESDYKKLLDDPNGNNEENEVELQERDKLLLKYMKLDIDKWVEESINISESYQVFFKRIISIRLKFNLNFLKLINTIDLFVDAMGNHGEELNKRSLILKDYCNKIVNEME